MSYATHSLRAGEDIDDSDILRGNRALRDEHVVSQGLDTKQKRVRSLIPRDVNAIINNPTIMQLQTAGALAGVKMVKNEEWLNKNRVKINGAADERKYREAGYTIKNHGKTTYAYTPAYVAAQKAIRKATYARTPIRALYADRLSSNNDVPTVRPGFVTTMVPDDVTPGALLQMFKPITGPDAQYPAWLRRYMNMGNAKRDVVFYDIGVLKIPGERRASRVAIYKENEHFEVFVPALTKKLVRTAARREPVRVEDADVRLAVAKYHKMADNARARLQSRGGVGGSLPRIDSNTDGGYSQIGYVSYWDIDEERVVVKALHGFVFDGRLIPYIYVTIVHPDENEKTHKPVLQRERRFLSLRQYTGGAYSAANPVQSTVLLVSRESHAFVTHSSLNVAPAQIESFETSKRSTYDPQTHSPGRLIDHKTKEVKSSLGDIVNISNTSNKRFAGMQDLIYRDNESLDHAKLSVLLHNLRVLNKKAIAEFSKITGRRTHTAVQAAARVPRIAAPAVVNVPKFAAPAANLGGVETIVIPRLSPAVQPMPIATPAPIASPVPIASPIFLEKNPAASQGMPLDSGTGSDDETGVVGSGDESENIMPVEVPV